MVLNAIFGTPNRDAARYKQQQIEFASLSAGNDLHNKGTSALKAKAHAKHLAQKFYSEKVFNAKLKIQGKVFKGSEDMARRLYSSSKVNEGNRSTRFGDTQSLMAFSKISQLENMARFVGGEGASGNINTNAIQLSHNLAKASATGGVGVSARMGAQWTKDNNLLKAVKLAASVATGDLGGAFGQLKSGGNANMLQWMGGKHTTGSDIFGRGGVVA